jgi:hypothetical protein
MDFSGAETLESGRSEQQVGVAYAPNLAGFLRDSTHGPINSFGPLFEVRAKTGATDRIELGAGAWTSGFPVSTIALGSADLGARLDGRYLLTQRGEDHCLALLGNVSGYYVINTFASADEFERSYGGTWGGGAGVVYEFVLEHVPVPQTPRLDLDFLYMHERETGVYAGAVVRYLYNDYTYGLAASESSSGVEEIRAHIDHDALVLSPFLGLRLPGPVCIEICGVMTRPPGGENVWGVFGGISFGRR